ncbi:MAG: MarR family transcriptional regulator [Actinobacteria bacterium]|nr:MarR family transcriptional regulator [Actinomycetota bacterium]
MSQFGRSSRIVQRFGLTPGHARALLMMDPDKPLPMGNLADLFSCDASTITWLVDRLEERGLVERRGLASDRRVKNVTLTPLGIRTKKELEEELYEPPEALLALNEPALRDLRQTLTDMVADGDTC